MAFQLDFPDSCALKEVEAAHKILVSDIRQRGRPLTSSLASQLEDTVSLLNFRPICACHNMSCEFWDGGHCCCNGNATCIELDYVIQGRVENGNNSPTQGELDT